MELRAEVEQLNRVKDYYGKVLQSSKDLQTSACCTADSMPLHAREVLRLIHSDIQDRFYGCGSPIPTVLEGKTVLDLGSGTGRDVFIFSKLVGPKGRVIGVDMTDEQLAVARKYIDHQTKAFGFETPNVEFHKGFIEDLSFLPDESVDIVTSNCVINLSPDKPRVFREVFRVLKPGGELYFSDVYSDRRIPKSLQEDPVLLGECLSGALYTEDFRRIMADLGCRDIRAVSKSPVTLNPGYVFDRLGMCQFSSITIRAFKLDLEDRCEDYGQVAYYKGTIPGLPHQFVLDDHHTFKTGQPLPVCSNTAAMLAKTRFAPHFQVTGDTSTHFGLFNCAPVGATVNSTTAASCC